MTSARQDQSSEEDLILFMPFSITSAETDMFGRLRLSSLINLLIQAAVQSADKLGFGYRDFVRRRLFWVLSRISLEIEKPLQWTHTGNVETWPKDVDKLLYIRDFMVTGRHHEVVARGTSGWLAVDTETRRSRNVVDADTSVFFRMKDKHGLSRLPEKLLHSGGDVVAEIKTTYFDIDINRHVTTTRYFDWMMDSFTPDFHQHHYPKKVSANFIKEIRPGEVVQLIRNTNDERNFFFEGHNLSRKNTAFRGYIGF